MRYLILQCHNRSTFRYPLLGKISVLISESEESDPANSSGGMSMAQVVDEFMKNLVTCVNRDFIDQVGCAIFAS